MSAPPVPAPFYLPIHLPEPKAERGPCPRNREIFDAVRVNQLSYRAAAVQFKLSPARIGEVLKQVEAWIARTGGGPTRTWQERARVSEYLHRGRAETCYAKLMYAFDNGMETRTDRVTLCEGKPEQRTVTLKTTKFDPRLALSAWKIEEARHAFEDVGENPPEPEDMTNEERIREAGVVTAEALALLREEPADEAEQAQSDEPHAVEMEVVAPPPPVAESAPPAPAAAKVDAGEPERPIEPCTDPDEYDADNPDQYWTTDERGFKVWSAPKKTIFSPCGRFWVRFQPLPPNPAVRRKKKPDGG